MVSASLKTNKFDRIAAWRQYFAVVEQSMCHCFQGCSYLHNDMLYLHNEIRVRKLTRF